MTRLKLTLTTLILLLAGCSAQPMRTLQGTAGTTSEHETATVTATGAYFEPLAVQPIDPAVLASLPPLPAGSPPAKGTSLLQDFSKFGNEDFAASPNASDSGSRKVLQSTAGSFSYAVYELP